MSVEKSVWKTVDAALAMHGENQASAAIKAARREVFLARGCIVGERV